MNAQKALLERLARLVERSKAELANEFKRGLLVLRYAGQCKCGMMLTQRDLRQKKGKYTCPRCGASGPLTVVG